MKHILCVVCALSLVATGCSELTEAQAKAKCVNVAQRWGIDLPAGPYSAERRQMRLSSSGSYWSVSFGDGERRFSVDEQNGEIRHYSDLTLELKARQLTANPAGKFWSTTEQLWAKGESILDAVNVRGLVRAKITRRTPENRRGYFGEVHLHFETGPYGYKANGFGNSSEIIFEEKTGKLRYFRVSRGFTYDPPRVVISSDRAKQLAAAICHESADHARANLMYITPNDGWNSTRGPALKRAKRLRLVYDCSFRIAPSVLIDAETGECLGGERMLADGSSLKKKPPTQNPPPTKKSKGGIRSN